MERVLKRAKEIKTLDKLVAYMRLLERKAYVLKDYFTVNEAADYLGVSKSRAACVECDDHVKTACV